MVGIICRQDESLLGGSTTITTTLLTCGPIWRLLSSHGHSLTGSNSQILSEGSDYKVPELNVELPPNPMNVRDDPYHSPIMMSGMLWFDGEGKGLCPVLVCELVGWVLRC